MIACLYWKFQKRDSRPHLENEATQQRVSMTKITVMLWKWQLDWDYAPTGRYTHSLLPNVSESLLIHHWNIYLFSTTNHGLFPFYLFKFDKVTFLQCTCGQVGTSSQAGLSSYVAFSPKKTTYYIAVCIVLICKEESHTATKNNCLYKTNRQHVFQK